MTCCCDELKVLKLYRGYPTDFNNTHWLTVKTKTEIPTDGWGARFEIGGVVKTYDSITPSFTITLTSDDTASLKNGIQNGTIVFIDSDGNDHPIATDIPVLVSDWVSGDIEMDGFTYNAVIELGENTLEVNIYGTHPTEELVAFVNEKIAEHDASESAHEYIQVLIKDESTARKESDNYIEGKIDEHIADFDNPHRVSKAQVGLGNVDNTSDADKPVSTAQEQAIKAIQDDLDSKATALGNRIDDEVKSREQGDLSLGSRIDEETQARSSADTALSSRIDDETTRAKGAETTLQSNIDAESKDRKDADTALGKRIDSEAKAREDADSLLSGKISEETGRATNAENDLQSKITAEATARADADTTLGGRIDDETSARETADSGLSKRITTNTNSITSINKELDTFGNIVTHNVGEFATSAQGAKADTALQPSALIPYRTADEQDAIDATKQNVISDLDTIRTNASTGAGLKPSVEANTASITTINGKIPTQASTTNQLADKDFVNSSINNVSAYYITKNAAGDPFATKAELTGATVFYSGGVVRMPTRNDYCVVLADESHKDESTGESPTTRYIYEGQWEFQYIVNNTALTAEQLSAVNSGITSELVSSYSAHIADKKNPHGVNKTQVGLGNVQNVDTTNANNITGGTLSNDRLGTIPYAKLSGVQATIPDLATIRTNATAGKNASDTIATYGNIVAHDANEFATASQGAKADSALQPKSLTPYRTASAQDEIDTAIRNAIPTNNNQLTNGAGYITESALLPYAKTADVNTALSGKQDTLTTAQLNAVNSGITSAKVEKYDGYEATITEAQEDIAQNIADIASLQTSKQDKISDLDTIRDGASKGATAVQPIAIADMETKTNASETYQPKGDYATNSSVDTKLAGKQDTLVSGTNIKTVGGQSLLGSGDIPSGGGMPIGMPFTIATTSSYVPDGCVPCDGSEYTRAQYPAFYDNYLIGTGTNVPKLKTTTYSAYNSAVSSYGYCDLIALDTTNQKFKVQTMPNGIYLGTAPSSLPVVGNGISLGLTNGTNNTGLVHHAGIGLSAYVGNYGMPINTPETGASIPSGNVGLGLTTDGAKSGMIANASGQFKVASDFKWFVCIANATVNESAMDWSAYQSGLASKVDKSNLVSAHAIIESYISSDGLSWYRVYDDGFIMQGGVNSFSFGSNNQNYWFIFPKAFTTTNYAFLRSNRGNANDGALRYVIGYQYDRKETTRIGMWVDSSAFSQGFDWIAWGK